MNASAIDHYLTEAAKDVIYAFVPRLTDKFGVGVPPKPNEDPFATWAKAFIAQVPNIEPDVAATAKESPEDFVRLMIDQFDATIVMVIGGDVSVFSRRRSARLPAEFLTKVREMVGIMPNDRVGWFSGLDAQPVDTIASEVIYGDDVENVSFEKTRPKVGRPMTRQQTAALRRKFWSGRTDPALAPDIVDKLLQ